jgi:hypothetical protein
MRRAPRRSESPRTVIERSRRVLSVDVPTTSDFPVGSRANDPAPTEASRQLAAAIDDALSRARRPMVDALAHHGVRSLTIIVSDVGGQRFEWDWSAQLNVVLDGKLLR